MSSGDEVPWYADPEYIRDVARRKTDDLASARRYEAIDAELAGVARQVGEVEAAHLREASRLRALDRQAAIADPGVAGSRVGRAGVADRGIR